MSSICFDEVGVFDIVVGVVLLLFIGLLLLNEEVDLGDDDQLLGEDDASGNGQSNIFNRSPSFLVEGV
jgi:hypothetical protein